MADINFTEIATAAYDALNACRKSAGEESRDRLKAQKNQATGLYTYLATWGLLRLKAEELAIDNGKAQKDVAKKGRKEVMIKFFEKLQDISGQSDLVDSTDAKTDRQDLKKLTRLARDGDEYLALSGLALSLAKEFGFWANAVYHDVQGGGD